MLPEATWQKCIAHLQDELPSQQFNTWIRPLRVELAGDLIHLCAPNRFVRDWVSDRFYSRIVELVAELSPPGKKCRLSSELQSDRQVVARPVLCRQTSELLANHFSHPLLLKILNRCSRALR